MTWEKLLSGPPARVMVNVSDADGNKILGLPERTRFKERWLLLCRTRGAQPFALTVEAGWAFMFGMGRQFDCYCREYGRTALQVKQGNSKNFEKVFTQNFLSCFMILFFILSLIFA